MVQAILEKILRVFLIASIGMVLFLILFFATGCGDNQPLEVSGDEERKGMEAWVSDWPGPDLELDTNQDTVWLDDRSFLNQNGPLIEAHFEVEIDGRQCDIEVSGQTTGGITGGYVTITDNRCGLENTTFFNRYRWGMQVSGGVFFRIYHLTNGKSEGEIVRLDFY